MLDLDPTDHSLLASLQSDASLTNLDLAKAVSVSPATALRRVRRLEEAGLIERRIAILSPAVMPQALNAIVEISLDRQGEEHLKAFEAKAVADAAVQQCWRVSPGPDFVLVVWAADMAGYRAVVERLFTQEANVRNVKSYFSVKRAKFEPGIGLGLGLER